MVAFYRKFLTKKALAGALVSKIGILAVVHGLFCTLLYLAYQLIMQDGIIVSDILAAELFPPFSKIG